MAPIRTPWKRLIRFVAAEDGREYYGEPASADLDVGLAYHNRQKITAHVLTPQPNAQTPAGLLALCAPDRSPSGTRTVARLLAPLSREQIGTIRALGANFVQPESAAKASEAEQRAKRPAIPILFYKPLSALAGPSDTIVVPRPAQADGDETDYEAELVVVIGRDGKDIRKEDALDYVLGYTLSNDVSARKRMFKVPQWGLGKSFDTFMPIGPVLVSAEAIRTPDALQLGTALNERTVQSFSTQEALWKCAETIAELSAGTTLEAGSIISMGTGPGEGFKRSPQVWLKDGDIVQVKGDAGLGTLVNVVREEGRAPRAKL